MSRDGSSDEAKPMTTRRSVRSKVKNVSYNERENYDSESDESDLISMRTRKKTGAKKRAIKSPGDDEELHDNSSSDDINTNNEKEENNKVTKKSKKRNDSNSRNVSTGGGLFAAFGFKKTDRDSCIDQMSNSNPTHAHVNDSDNSGSENSVIKKYSGSDHEDDSVYEATPPKKPSRKGRRVNKTRDATSTTTVRAKPRRSKQTSVSYTDPDSSDDFDNIKTYANSDEELAVAIRISQQEARSARYYNTSRAKNTKRVSSPKVKTDNNPASSSENENDDISIKFETIHETDEKIEDHTQSGKKKKGEVKKSKDAKAKPAKHQNSKSVAAPRIVSDKKKVPPKRKEKLSVDKDGNEEVYDPFEDSVEVLAVGSGDDSEVQYRIQHILGSRSLCASDWKILLEKNTTQEVSRGSVWMQSDEEFNSTSPQLIEKFLIKWQHASYLHVSWEREGDLIESIGTHAKTQIKKYRLYAEPFHLPSPSTMKSLIGNNEEAPLNNGDVDGVSCTASDDVVMTECTCNGTLFDDLSVGEFFSPSVMTVDRVLAVDDDVDSGDIDWENAPLPSLSRDGSASETMRYLHTPEGFLTIKWEGLNYSESTFEKISDLQAANVEFERQLRKFYQREQLPPAYNARRTIVKRQIDAEVMKNPPTFSHPDLCLRDYQWDGVRWLLFNWSQRRSSILADEMGLGKTIQTAAFLQVLSRYQNVRGPFLIVAPLSTVVNWQREVTLWTDFDVILYHGNKDDRDIAREFDFFYTQHKDTNKKSKAQSGYKIQVVITTPETCLLSDDPKSPRPSKELSNIYWDMLVVDEAHKLKNYNSRITVTLREEFKYSNTLLLTGTPLQNNVEELWTLLNFVDNQYFNSLESFIYDFGDLKESKQLVKLQGHLGPYLLKREKENVETSVPPKEEVIIEVELTAPQKQYYRALYENNKTFLCRSNSGSKHNGPSLTNLAMELRKCCNHPFLIRGAEEELMKHFKQKIKNENLKALEDEKSDVKPLTKSMRESMEQECIVQASGKLILLDKLLPKLQADGHKVLIFSQFRIMLDVLQDYIELRQFSFERIDGAITGKRRQQAIDKYSAPGSQIFVMLLSTRAGGVGINLTAADTVLIFDSDWNPQNDIQAQARAHRIGQTKPVKVYRLLTRKTYEMQMFQSASLKLGLDYAIMHNTGKNAHALISPTKQISKKPLPNESLSLSNKEIEGLLKYGAYDMFREEKEGISDQASTNFNNSDIDSILARSTVIVHDSNNVSSNPGKKLPNFSTASFVANDEQTVDIDDPDFWTKVVGLTVDEDEVVKLGKRKCREKSYINYADNGFNFKTNIYRDESSDSDSVVESNSDEEHVLEVDDVVNSQDSNNGSNPINEAKSEDSNTEVKRRRRQTKRQNLKVPEIVPAVWSFENVAKLSTTLLDTGYGNWEKIRHRSKLNFPLYDIALGCRHVVLYWTRLACMGDDDSFVFRYENDELVSAQVNYPSEDTRDIHRYHHEMSDGSRSDVLHSIQPADRDDIALLLARLQSSRMLRLVILSHQLDETNRQQMVSKSTATKGEYGEDVALSNSNKVDAEKLIPENVILSNYRDADPFLVKSDFKYWDADSPMWKSHRLGHSIFMQIKHSHSPQDAGGAGILPQDFMNYAFHSADPEYKKAVKAKLQQLDEMFTLYHAVFLADSYNTCEKSAADCATKGEKYGPFNPWRSPNPFDSIKYRFDHIEPVEDNLSNSFSCELTRYLDCALLMEDSPTDWWTPYEDMLLVRGVVKIGWPRDQCRYDALKKYIANHETYGFLSRGPLEVSSDFKSDIVLGGGGYSEDPGGAVSSLTSKELLPANIKSDIMRRLKEIIHVLENENPKAMSLFQRQKNTFSSYLVKFLGRFGMPVDLPEDQVSLQDEFSIYELTTADVAQRLGCKIIRKSEINKVIAAVKSVSLKRFHDYATESFSHADVILMNFNVINSTREKMLLLQRARYFFFIEANRDDSKAIKFLVDAENEVRLDLMTLTQIPTYWSSIYDLRAIKILMRWGYNAFRFNMVTMDSDLRLTPDSSVAFPRDLTERHILSRLTVLLRGVTEVLTPGYTKIAQVDVRPTKHTTNSELTHTLQRHFRYHQHQYPHQHLQSQSSTASMERASASTMAGDISEMNLQIIARGGVDGAGHSHNGMTYSSSTPEITDLTVDDSPPAFSQVQVKPIERSVSSGYEYPESMMLSSMRCRDSPPPTVIPPSSGSTYGHATNASRNRPNGFQSSLSAWLKPHPSFSSENKGS